MNSNFVFDVFIPRKTNIFNIKVFLFSILDFFKNFNDLNLYLDKNLNNFLKNYYLIYLKNWIAHNNYTKVVTFVDNSSFFFRLSNLCNCKFLAIQNGFRSEIELKEVFFDIRKKNN